MKLGSRFNNFSVILIIALNISFFLSLYLFSSVFHKRQALFPTPCHSFMISPRRRNMKAIFSSIKKAITLSVITLLQIMSSLVYSLISIIYLIWKNYLCFASNTILFVFSMDLIKASLAFFHGSFSYL